MTRTQPTGLVAFMGWYARMQLEVRGMQQRVEPVLLGPSIIIPGFNSGKSAPPAPVPPPVLCRCR